MFVVRVREKCGGGVGAWVGVIVVAGGDVVVGDGASATISVILRC